MKKPDPIAAEINLVKTDLSFRKHQLGSTRRIDRKTAQRILKENMSYIVSGTVRYFQIKNIGLGICEIAFQPCMIKTTSVVTKFSFEK